MTRTSFPAQLSALACRMGAAFAPLPLNRNLTKVRGFSLVCLERRKLANPCSTRHSEGKEATDFSTAGAGERGKRFANSIPSCRKQNGDLLLVLWGYLRGYPLDIPIKRKVNHRSVFGTRVSNGRIICLARPLLRWASESPSFLWSALCYKCCRILIHRGTPEERCNSSLLY